MENDKKLLPDFVSASTIPDPINIFQSMLNIAEP